MDALDQIVGHLCHADLASEDPYHLNSANFLKLFRLAQLALEYLLFVQDTLSNDCQNIAKQRLGLFSLVEFATNFVTDCS